MSTEINLADMFPPEMQKYGLTFDFMNAGDSIVAIVAMCWQINADIESAKNSATDSKVATHPYDVKASKDKGAAEVSANLIKAFVAACDAAITKNKNVAYHLAETDNSLTAYLTSEKQYYRFKAAPAKPAIAGTKLDTLRHDRKVLTQKARELIETFPILANDPRLVKEDGKVKLPNLQGAGAKSGDNPTGKHAKWSKDTIWIIDGTKYPIGTDPRDLVRAIWSGVERVGKKPSDIFSVIDAERAKLKLNAPADITVEINGKSVTYREVKSESK